MRTRYLSDYVDILADSWAGEWHDDTDDTLLLLGLTDDDFKRHMDEIGDCLAKRLANPSHVVRLAIEQMSADYPPRASK